MVDLHLKVEISASADEVFDAIGTSGGNQGWWTRDSSVEEKVGGEAVFGFENRAAVYRMTVDEFDPGKTLVMSCQAGHPEWIGTRLDWRIDNTEEGATALTLVHRNWREMTSFCALCNATWGHLLYRLKDYVETGERNPRWD